MTTFQDASIGLKKEAAYGTPVTVDRWYEFSENPDFDFSPKRIQGEHLYAGARVDRVDRRCTPTWESKGGFEVPLLSKKMGALWELAMGSGVSTLVSTGLYQHNFTFADDMPSATIQLGQYNGSAVEAHTYNGMMITDFELSIPNADRAALKTSWNGQDKPATATAYATPSYTSGMEQFCFATAAIYTGTFTAPTATALASATVELTNVRSLTVKVDHALNVDRYNMSSAYGGRKSKPHPGRRKVSGTIEFEMSTAFRDAFLADTTMGIVGTLTNGTNVIQCAIPCIKLDGKMPSPDGKAIPVISAGFTALWDGTTQPLYISTRTSDATL